MTSLTRIAYYTRKGVIFGIAGIVLFLILKTALGVATTYWRQTHPASPPSPTVLFGKLESFKFPSSEYSYPQEIILQTIGGELPEASASAKAYQIPKELPSLLADQHARQFAAQLEFKGNPISKTSTEYKFQDPINPLRTLDLNIITNNFSLKYDYLKDSQVFKEGSPPSPEQAKIEAEQFLNLASSFPKELKKGERKVSFLKLSGDQFIPATSLSKADAVRVDFFKENLEDNRLLPPEYDQSSIYVIISGSKDKKKKIIEAQFRFFKADKETSSTYPIKTPQQAWEELKNGQGFIARWKKGHQKAVVRDVYLAYYDPPEYQPFLQPIFVFEGDDQFVAYIQAIKHEWLD